MGSDYKLTTEKLCTKLQNEDDIKKGVNLDKNRCQIPEFKPAFPEHVNSTGSKYHGIQIFRVIRKKRLNDPEPNEKARRWPYYSTTEITTEQFFRKRQLIAGSWYAKKAEALNDGE